MSTLSTPELAAATPGLTLLPRLTLRFGPYVLRFRSADPSACFSVDDATLPFVAELGGVSEDDAAVECDVDCRVGEIVATPAEPAAVSGVWRLVARPDGGEEIVFRYGTPSRPAFLLRFSPSFREATLVQAPHVRGTVIGVAGSALIEYMLVRLAGRTGAVHVHSSTAILGGGAYVFVGHSGAGKSTMAGFAEAAGARLPTDDRTLLTCDGDGVWAWGTPWYGSLQKRSPEGAPVRAIYLLRQASTNAVEWLSPERAVKELFVRAIQPRLTAREVDGTLAALESITHRVPVGVLHCRKEPRAFAVAVDAATERSDPSGGWPVSCPPEGVHS